MLTLAAFEISAIVRLHNLLQQVSSMNHLKYYLSIERNNLMWI